ncbi:MAG: adenosine deaminase [Elusimicrobiota bacterium]
MDIKELLKKIPKVDLHCHLDGSVRAETILELAKKQNIKLPTPNPDELKKYVQVSKNCRSLAEFLKVFNFFYPLLKNPEAVEKIAYQLCEDCKAENIKYFETRFAPALQSTADFPMDEVVKKALFGLQQGSRDFKIKANAILCCYRMITDDENWQTVELARKYSDKGVVGVDLAGDEVNYPTEKFIKFLKKAKSYKIPLTCHIGETPMGSGMKKIFDIPVDRIGHGVHLSKSSEKLIDIVKEKKIPIEMCITSNIQTQVVESLEAHPIKEFYNQGLKVTVNTDDRSVSGIDLTHEYDILVNHLGFELDDLVKIIFNGVDAAFLPEQDKKNLALLIKKEINTIIYGTAKIQTAQ